MSGMPAKGFRKPRLCACGCGRSLKEVFKKTGERAGYEGVYAPDCEHRFARGIPRPAIRGPNHHRFMPPGSSRTERKTAGGVFYRYIKMADGTWRAEHRIVMERILGRPLKTKELVHHKNGNGLDNRPANLELVDRGHHNGIHHGLPDRWARLYGCCIECGETTSKHVSRGLCSRCYQRKRR